MKSSNSAVLLLVYILWQPPAEGAPGSPRSRLGLSAEPSAMEILQSQWFEAPLIPTREPTASENEALIAAVERFAARAVRDDFSSLTTYLETQPNSPWAQALLTQLGSEYYRVGRYSKAIEAWKRAWVSGSSDLEGHRVANANRAGSELALMYARLGRMTELRSLLGQLEKRPNRGLVPRNMRGARDGLWSMEHRPEVSFRCGSLALDRICFATDRAKAGNQLIQDSQSSTNGFSAKQVADLSRQLGMNYQVAFRASGAEVILPAVVHWKVGHYAALIARDGDLLRAEDPTFGSSKVWLSEEALNEEASGYFLVRSGPLPNGWREVSATEASRVWGKGATHISDHNETTDDSEQTCRQNNQGREHGMAQWNVHLLLASHRVEDTPVGYTPPVGPPVYIRVTYNSVNGWPDYGLRYSNVSQEWRLNWLAYLTDDPLNPAGDVKFAANGGGTMTFTDFNPTNQVFKNLFRNRANLVRTGTNSYEIRYPDGSRQLFDQPENSVGTARRIFMSAVVDAAGNAATIQFDQPGRITSITDAIGQKTRFFYERPLTNEFIHPSVAWVPPFLLTRVVDPFGRTARFNLGSSINARLSSITDAIGITSSFLYDYKTNELDLGMTNLITPYGTTAFQQGSHRGVNRANWVEITHPNGEKERVEYSEELNLPWSEPLGIVPKGVPVRNYVLWARNTCHWDRKAYAEGYAKLDYTKARIYHWLHGQDYATASGILESYKNPLEHRVWFNYDGQVNATFVGTSDQPTKIARTLEDGTTQLYQFEYNSLRKPTKAVDPLGRTFSFNYSTNEVDLLEVRQTRAGQNELLISATYNSQHLPLTVKNAARQATSFSYNARGQILAITNPLSHVATFAYDTNGYLLAVDGPLPGTNDTSRFTYDNVGRVRTATDVDGYTMTFDYDALDRLTRSTYPDSSYEEITYNRLDPEVLRDRAGRETRLTFDSLRQLVAAQDPLGRVTRYDWCGCGGLDSVIDPMGRMTRWIRDVQGRLKAKQYADGSQIQYDYDTATGWLKSIRDERNQVTQFDYNLDGTLRQKRYFNAPVPTPSVKFTYDPNYPRLLTMEAGTNVTTYGYHPITGNLLPGAGRLASVDGPLPNDSITFVYDELGRVAQREIGGVATKRSWDQAGRVTQLTNALGLFTFGWDSASWRLSSVLYPNGQTTEYAYHPNSRDQLLQSITHRLSDNAILAQFSYLQNVVGQVTNWTQFQGGRAQIWGLSYDAADRLLGVVVSEGGLPAQTFNYTYDDAGNRTSEQINGVRRLFFHNAPNQLTAISNGTPDSVDYEWDAAHRLVAITEGTHRTEFAYDGFSRRTRIVEKENGTVVTDRRYLWCGSELCEERDSTGTVRKRFYGQGESIVANDAAFPAGNYFYVRDHLTSVRTVVSQGSVLAETTYEPYGRAYLVSGTTGQAFGFGGYLNHSASGLSLAWFREYDSGVGRWLNRDPIGEAGGFNLYGYVDADPVNLIDPLGLAPDVNLYPVKDPLHDYYDKIKGDPDVIAVGAHGFEGGFSQVSIDQLVKEITSTVKWQEGVRKVRLDSCLIAKSPDAQALANKLAATLRAGDKVELSAPDAYFVVDARGKTALSSKMVGDADGVGRYVPFVGKKTQSAPDIKLKK